MSNKKIISIKKIVMIFFVLPVLIFHTRRLWKSHFVYENSTYFYRQSIPKFANLHKFFTSWMAIHWIIQSFEPFKRRKQAKTIFYLNCTNKNIRYYEETRFRSNRFKNHRGWSTGDLKWWLRFLICHLFNRRHSIV